MRTPLPPKGRPGLSLASVPCRDAAKIDKTRRFTLTRRRRAAGACQSGLHSISSWVTVAGAPEAAEPRDHDVTDKSRNMLRHMAIRRAPKGPTPAVDVMMEISRSRGVGPIHHMTCHISRGTRQGKRSPRPAHRHRVLLAGWGGDARSRLSPPRRRPLDNTAAAQWCPTSGQIEVMGDRHRPVGQQRQDASDD
jgi:hypothetical protein